MSLATRCQAFLLALLLAAALHCGGSQQAPKPGMDTETGESSDVTDKPKARGHQAKPAASAEVVVLSLAGIPVLKKAEAGGAGKEGEADPAEPPPGKIGPPLPPAGADQGATEEEATTAPAEAPVASLPPRNLFAFEEDPAVVQERQRKAEEAAAQAAEAAKKLAEARAQEQEYLKAHPPPPQPPAIPFQFIGYMGPPEDRIGVFASPALTLARKGDVILGKFKIVSIGYESAEIGFTGFTQTQRIPLSAGGK